MKKILADQNTRHGHYLSLRGLIHHIDSFITLKTSKFCPYYAMADPRLLQSIQLNHPETCWMDKQWREESCHSGMPSSEHEEEVRASCSSIAFGWNMFYECTEKLNQIKMKYFKILKLLQGFHPSQREVKVATTEKWVCMLVAPIFSVFPLQLLIVVEYFSNLPQLLLLFDPTVKIIILWEVGPHGRNPYLTHRCNW